MLKFAYTLILGGVIVHCVRKVNESYTWIGGNDHRLSMFEGIYDVPKGMSYNSYLLMDEKTVLFDTVDEAVGTLFLENLTYTLGGRNLDYVIVHHMEPDHSALLIRLLAQYPELKIVCTNKSATYLKQFFHVDVSENIMIVTEGSTLQTGNHELKFIMAPMVHWPEVMVTYDSVDKILFTADAFGTFGTLDGALFADEVDFAHEFMDEARRYYCNVVGKYGTQVEALLKKIEPYEISMICPLHGLAWRRDLEVFFEKYRKWSRYEAEEAGVLIAYASVYGDTKNVAEIVACRLRERGIKTQLFDVSVTPSSYIIASAFRWSHLLFASTTYNAKIFVLMEQLLTELVDHNLQNKTVALIENGTWAATSGRLMKALLEKCKNFTFIEETLSIKSSIRLEQEVEVERLVSALEQSVITATNIEEVSNQIDPQTFIKVPYGLYLLTSKDGEKDNGCIINTTVQITINPNRVMVAVNKQNYTHDMILKSGMLGISILTEETPFSLLERFGFQSGQDVNKFEDFNSVKRSQLGVLGLTQYSNAFISGKIIAAHDYGTHTVFVAEVVEAEVLSAANSLTYSYYYEHIKPKPQPVGEKKKGFVCKVCGYIYEGEVLPEDYICPVCKHGASDFEPLK